jgi:transposase
MDDVKADAKGGFRRIEMLTGPARRRQWSASEKARIVAETLIDGALVSEVARRWQVCPQQVFTLRREARAGVLVLPSETGISANERGFVPIVAETPPVSPVTVAEDAVGPTAKPTAKPASAPVIEIKLAGMVVRVAVGTDPALLTEVLRAVRASAA